MTKWLVSFLVLALSGLCSAQSDSATLSGRVADPSGAAIVGAEVVLTNTQTSVEQRTKTNGVGLYVFAGVHPGTYRVTAGALGFRVLIKEGLTLHVQDELAENFSLTVGAISESMTVTADATPINTTDGTVGTVIDRQFVANLPLSGRSFQDLISMNPGVVATNASVGFGGEFSVNGQRSNANYFTVDGVSANAGANYWNSADAFSQTAGGALPGMTALGTTASLVSVDALEEFRIQTSTYSAEFGRQPGGQVQLITRSGGNQFHGTAFEYLRNDAMDAQDWFTASTALAFEQAGLTFQKPELRQNDFGATFSGPIFKNKTFFFFSYEGVRLRQPVVSPTANYVPAMWLRQAAAPALQPFLNSYSLPTGKEVQVPENPTIPYDPVTNPYVPSGFAPAASNYSNPSSVDAYSIRIDHAIGSNLRLFGRYAETPSDSLTRTLNQLAGVAAKSRTLTLGATLSVTPRLNNDFRFNYSNNSSAGVFTQDGMGGAKPLTLGQSVSPYNGPGPADVYLQIGFGPLNATTLLGNASHNYQRQVNVVDNLLWARGRHQLKFGVDWRHLTPIFAPNAYSNSITVGSSLYPPDYSQYIYNVENGIANVYLSDSQGAKPIYDDVSAYVQDTWKVSSRLNLDFGVRWEINPPPHTASGLSPILITGLNGVDVSSATLAPYGTSLYKVKWTALAPRVGFAYQLDQRSGHETVLRGSFGLFYDLGSNMALAGYSGYPFQSSSTLNNVTLPLTSAEAQAPAFPANPADVTLPVHQGDLYAIDHNLTLPYTMEWNVALQQALGRQQTLTLSYVASAGRRLTILEYLNQIPTSTANLGGSNQDQYRPNPNLEGILYVQNSPTSDYNSLQAQFQRRLSKGLQALVSYTWSHAIDDASYDSVGSGTALSRGNADFDVRHSLSAAVTYDCPKVTGAGPGVESFGRLLRAITNGWSTDSIFTARTGRPLDVQFGTQNLLNGEQVVLRPDVVPGQRIWINNPTVPGGQELNVNAFAYPANYTIYPYPTCPTCAVTVYQQGDLSRNRIQQPGMYQINFALRRQFNITDRWKLQAKGEAFNVLNHPLFSYGSYAGVNYWYPTNTTFGVPFQTLANAMGGFNVGGGLNPLYQNGGPRSMQVSLKLTF